VAAIVDFRLRFPEFTGNAAGGVQDVQVASFLQAAALELSTGVWGGYYAPPAAWTSLTAHLVGDQVSSTTYNGYLYQCTVAGTTGASAPTFSTTIGGTFADGGATWLVVGPSPLMKIDMGQMWLAAHKLVLSPFGQNAKMVVRPTAPRDRMTNPYSRTTYGQEFYNLLRSVTAGYRVC
jgi:hypothetical protein